jgi:formate dehydrogenase subunit gamma
MLNKSYKPWSIEAATAIIAQTCDKPGPVLISLQALQAEFGFIPESAVALVAYACNVSRAEVHGVLTFYSDLRTTPSPADLIRICVAEACQAVGSRELVSALEKEFGVNLGDKVGKVELEPVYCFGNCALGPAVNVNGKLIGRATPQSIKAAR